MMAMTEEETTGSAARNAAGLLLSGALGLFLLGVVTGIATNWISGDAVKIKAAIVFAICVPLGIASALGARHFLKKLNGGAVSSSTRKSRLAVQLAIAAGVLGGMAAGITNAFGMEFALFSNAPAPALAVISLIAVWCLLAPALSIMWWRHIDEHEKAAYSSSALIALNAYSIITPGWWLLWRGGMAPAVDPMIVFLSVITLWGAVWMVRRYA